MHLTHPDSMRLPTKEEKNFYVVLLSWMHFLAEELRTSRKTSNLDPYICISFGSGSADPYGSPQLRIRIQIQEADQSWIRPDPDPTSSIFETNVNDMLSNRL